MRHLKGYRKLNRTASHRSALLKNLVTSLMRHGQVRTTDAKAKELRRVADKVLSLGKKSALLSQKGMASQELQTAQLHMIRSARLWINDPEAMNQLFRVHGPALVNRPGGYTRVIKIGPRAGDGAPMSVVEVVTDPVSA